MTLNNKTARDGAACRCVELCITCECNPTKSPLINQQHLARIKAAISKYADRRQP